MKYVEPYNNNHAIKGVAFAIEFIEELAEKDFRNAINLYNTKLESNFKEPIEHEGFTIKIDEQGRQVSNNTLSGISFNSKDDVWSVQLRQNALIVTSNVYTRWADMWIQTKAYFEKFCEILSEKKVSLIAMEYIDEYNISNINSDWKNELFKQDSQYLPKYIYSINNLWHVHQGFFKDVIIEKLEYQLLTNVNIDLRKKVDNDNFFLAMRTQHKSMVSDILYNQMCKEQYDAIFDYSHELNKQIVSDIISDEMMQRINLKVEK